MAHGGSADHRAAGPVCGMLLPGSGGTDARTSPLSPSTPVRPPTPPRARQAHLGAMGDQGADSLEGRRTARALLFAPCGCWSDNANPYGHIVTRQKLPQAGDVRQGFGAGPGGYRQWADLTSLMYSIAELTV